MISDSDFRSLRCKNIMDWQDRGLAVYLENTYRDETESVTVFGFLLNEEEAREFVREISDRIDKKWGTKP